MTPPNENNGDDGCRTLMALVIFVAFCVTGTLLYAGLSKDGIGIHGEWVWQVNTQPNFDSLGPSISLAGILLLALWAVLQKWKLHSKCREVASVTGLVLLLFLIQMAAGNLGKIGNVETILFSFPPSNAYFERALGVESVGDYLKTYEREIRDGPFRVQLSTHPPGSVLFYVPFIRISESWPSLARFIRIQCRRLKPFDGAYELPVIEKVLSRVSHEAEGAAWAAALALRFVACLVVIPAYLLCRNELESTESLTAATLTGLIPAMFLFSPHPDQMFPVISTAFFLFLYLTLKTMRWWWGLAAGLTLWLGMFFSLSFLLPSAAGVVFCGITVWKKPKRGHALLAGSVVLGFVIPCVLLLLFFDHNPAGVWSACSLQNDEFNSHSLRTYWKWFLYNPLEILVFAGAPVFVLFWFAWASETNSRILGGGHGMEEIRSEDASDNVNADDHHNQEKDVRLSDALIALGLAILLLNLSGKNLGEVGRLWMIVMPLMAAVCASKLNLKSSHGVVLALITLQVVQLLGIRTIVQAMGLF